MLTCREKHNGIAPSPRGARALRPARPTHIPPPPSMPSVLRTPPPAPLASARPRARSARGGARPATAEMMMHASHRQTNNVVERSCWTTLKGCFDSRARFHTASESFVDEAHVLPTGERFGARTTCDAFERDDHEVLVCACAPEPPPSSRCPLLSSRASRVAASFFVFALTRRRLLPRRDIPPQTFARTACATPGTRTAALETSRRRTSRTSVRSCDAPSLRRRKAGTRAKRRTNEARNRFEEDIVLVLRSSLAPNALDAAAAPLIFDLAGRCSRR